MRIFLVLVFAISLLVPPTRAEDENKCGDGFIYNGKVYSLNTSFDKKGEGLRPIIKNNSKALAYLDRYQSNHSKSLRSAYTGTLGLILALVTSYIATSTDDKGKAKNIRALGLGFAGVLTLGGLFLSTKYLYENDKNLTSAISIYNSSSKNKIVLSDKKGIKIKPDITDYDDSKDEDNN